MNDNRNNILGFYKSNVEVFDSNTNNTNQPITFVENNLCNLPNNDLSAIFYLTFIRATLSPLFLYLFPNPSYHFC